MHIIATRIFTEFFKRAKPVLLIVSYWRIAVDFTVSHTAFSHGCGLKWEIALLSDATNQNCKANPGLPRGKNS
jgi:hypothetical protein